MQCSEVVLWKYQSRSSHALEQASRLPRVLQCTCCRDMPSQMAVRDPDMSPVLTWRYPQCAHARTHLHTHIHMYVHMQTHTPLTQACHSTITCRVRYLVRYTFMIKAVLTVRVQTQLLPAMLCVIIDCYQHNCNAPCLDLDCICTPKASLYSMP